MARFSSSFRSLCFVLAYSVNAHSVHAQEMTVSDLISRFSEHKMDIQATRNIGGAPHELRRGLILVVNGEQIGTTTQEVEFAAVEPENQVNIRVVFDLDSAELRADQIDRLGAVCQAMREMNTTLFQIIGHTDASGPETHNDTLSVNRAEAVRSHMVEDCGVSSLQVQAIGVGERYLLDADRPRAEANRRVEFQAIGDIQG